MKLILVPLLTILIFSILICLLAYLKYDKASADNDPSSKLISCLFGACIPFCCLDNSTCLVEFSLFEKNEKTRLSSKFQIFPENIPPINRELNCSETYSRLPLNDFEHFWVNF
jgi:hypothetical protein